MRRRMGAAALEMDAASDGSGQTRWRATVATRLPSQRWPERTVLITAVNAHTGEPVVFDRHSGVDLVDAVAASCASGFAYSIGGSRYIDGGYRSNAENADLAAGYARVLVLSPFGGRSRTPVDWGMHLATQVDELRARGSRVETIFPDSNSAHRIRRQCDGSVDASARRSSRLQPRQSPCRAAHRILALTPTNPIDSVGVTTPAHASDGRWARHAPYLRAPWTWARSVVLTNLACGSWVNGSSPVVRCWPAGSSRPTSSPGGVAVADARCAARQRDPAAGARAAGVAPDGLADHDPPLSLHRLRACVAPGHQPGAEPRAKLSRSRAAMGASRHRVSALDCRSGRRGPRRRGTPRTTRYRSRAGVC